MAACEDEVRLSPELLEGVADQVACWAVVQEQEVAQGLPPRIDRSASGVQQDPEPKVKATTRAANFAKKKTPQCFKNPTDLQVRMRTGTVYIVITIACILLGPIPTVLMLSATAGICASEFYYMVRRDAKLPNELLGTIAAVLYPLSAYFLGWSGLVCVTVALMLSLLIWYVFWTRSRIGDVSVSFFGACYTGMLLSGLIVIRSAIPGFWGSILLLAVYASVWANDSFAYLVGSKLGRHKLAPQLSPKKSWEGFIAGLIFSGLAWIGISFIPGVTLGIPQAFVFGVICAFMEVLGDLAESRIKRNVGVKDSGTIMPGHGGLLDRCDSLFLAAITSTLLLVGSGAIPFSM